MSFAYDVSIRTGPSIIAVYMVLLVTILVTNGLVMKVWLSAANRSTSTITLSLIALYDTLTMVCGAFHKITIYISLELLQTVACYFDPIFYRLAFFFHSMSIFTTTFLAIQRCVVCAFPFAGPTICGIRTIFIATVMSAAVLIFVPLHDFIFYERFGTVNKTLDNTTTILCHLKYTGALTKKTLDVMEGNMRFVVYQVIPACITTFCMLVCIITVNKRKKMNVKAIHNQETMRTTVMLVFVMLIFILGELPATLMMIAKSFFPSTKHVLRSSIFSWFSNIALALSYLANIWVYIGMSKQFRESLKITLGKICYKQDSCTNNASLMMKERNHIK